MLIAVIYLALKISTGWNWFVVWLITVNTITFLVYGLDKGMAKTIRVRVPELFLHGLALAGGFIGGWTGMFVFHHKTNWRTHPLFPIMLSISTATYVLLIIFG
jgi:uncharacterized membrane protein YsdA (DUF1294 family)